MSSRRISSSNSLKSGQRVEYSLVTNNGEKKLMGGVIAYGPGPFHLKPNENDWCGVILDEPVGKNNGIIQGRQYFSCPANFGVMVRASTLRPIGESTGSKASKSRSSRSSTPSTPNSITPSSSIQSFTGMFDSGSSNLNADKGSKMSDSVSVLPQQVSKLRPPTNVMSSSSHEILATASTAGQPPKLTTQTSIRQMVEKLEIKRDEMMREDDAAQDISHTVESTSSQSSTPSHKTKEVQEMNEKIKDLESKLNTLMLKRAEDRQKFKEFERIKIQNEQLLENKKQMAEKIAELSKLKFQAEKEAKEAREEQLQKTEEIKDLVDNAEMAVIDKEMAENRAEQLQLELEQAKEQLEEARLDFEILKTEIEDKGVDGAANSFQVKQLEEQNSRYKEALLKLRDISATDRSNIQLLQKDVERKNEELNVFIQEKDKQKIELEKCYEQINDLKEQVDMALGSQEMVEKLTEKNLSMEDKIEELQNALDEEEKIKELSNIIIEEKDDIIADLRDEVEKYKVNLVNLRNNYVAMQDVARNHETTIKKFRDLVAMLKEENSTLRTAQQIDTTKQQQAVNVQAQLENIEFKARLLDRRDLSRSIDMDLRQLDVDQCYRHMVYLARFLSDSFFARGGDHDAIAVLLFVPRIIAKCSIIERQINEKYLSGLESNQENQISPDSIVREVFDVTSTTNGGSSIQIESIDKLKMKIFTKHILYLLTSIRSILNKYQDILARCDGELFMRLGSLFPEFTAHEKNIDYYVELLREDKLDETMSLDSLEKTLGYLQSLYNIHIASNSSTTEVSILADNHNKFLNDLLDVFRTGSEASILDIKVLSKITTSDASMFLTTLETCLTDIDQFLKKIRRRMVSSGSSSVDANPICLVRFSSSVEAELLDTNHHFLLILRSLKTIRSTIMTQYLNQIIQCSSTMDDNQKDSESKVSYVTLNELESVCKELTGNSLKSLSEMLTNVMSVLCKFCTALQQGDYDVSKNESSLLTTTTDGTSLGSLSSHLSIPSSLQSFFNTNRYGQSSTLMVSVPLDQRAALWRAKTEQISEFQSKLNSQESDILELRRVLKSKIDEVSEMQIRRDMAEKKLKEAQRESQKLQEELEHMAKEFKDKEAERERTLNKYNQEINELYSDQRMMKEKLKEHSKNALLGKILVSSTSSPHSPGGSNSPNHANSSMNFGNHSLTSNQFSTPNTSLYMSLSSTVQGNNTNASSNGAPDSSIITNIVEQQQQILDLRSAMKRLAARNTELKTMLASNHETYQLNTDGSVVKTRPAWYLEALRRVNANNQKEEEKAQRLQSLKSKVTELQLDLARYRCSASLLPNIDKLPLNRSKPGWSRCISNVIRKNMAQDRMQLVDFGVRIKQLQSEVNEFIKTFDEGFSCDSTFASFIAPHVSKNFDSTSELVARISVGGGRAQKNSARALSCSASVIPIEVTTSELNRIQSMLLC